MGRHSRSRSRSRSRHDHRSRSRSRSRSSSSDEIDGFRVHVGDLGIDCSRREIEKVFEKFGPIYEVWLARNPPCFAFVKFRHREDAEEAIEKMNGKLVCGSRVRVGLALPRTRGRRRRSFDPNLRCYTCGERGHFSRDCGEVWSNKGYTASFRARSHTPEHRRGQGQGQGQGRSGSMSNNRKRSRSPEKKRSRSRERKRSRSRSRERRRRSRSKSKSQSREKHTSSRDKKERRRHSSSGQDRNNETRGNNRDSHETRPLVADYDEGQDK